MDRRQWLQQGLLTAASLVAASTLPSPAKAADTAVPERDALLQAIASKSNDEIVLKCIDDLVKVTTSSSTASLTDRIDGNWKLIWSVKDDKFSPLLQLPPPLKPTSYQLAGSAATPQVGEGRIAQMLEGGILGPNQAWLSSGIVEYSKDLLQIQPPFRFEMETPFSSKRIQLVDAGSDADFRAANVRTQEAQQAPPNLYQQLYVEDGLRISKIVEGDPVIVGATFVHIKL